VTAVQVRVSTTRNPAGRNDSASSHPSSADSAPGAPHHPVPEVTAPVDPVVVEPADQPWGERLAEVADPAGNRVIVALRARRWTVRGGSADWPLPRS